MAKGRRLEASEQLREFAEDRYLHQTMVKAKVGDPPTFYEDLPQALDEVDDPARLTGQWRVHYHVPIYLERFGFLETSRDDLLRCLDEIRRVGDVDHLEVETYVWELLPRELRHPELADGIAEELRWLRDHLAPAAPV
ncbi:MAG: hypothetical protein JJ992_00760 [Planctomycetes bacterium]|nr:hypothetical protein [Planctomycetota bacterium]